MKVTNRTFAIYCVNIPYTQNAAGLRRTLPLLQPQSLFVVRIWKQ